MENIWRIYVESLIRTIPNDGMVTSHHPAVGTWRQVDPANLSPVFPQRGRSQISHWDVPSTSFNRLLKNRGEKKTHHSNWFWVFPQQQNFAMGSLAQISSGAIRCSFNTRFRTRFRRVLVQIPCEVPEGSVRFRRVPVQIPCEVPEGSGADTLWGSGGFRCRYLVRFRKFPVQVLYSVRFRRVQILV